MKKTYTPPTIDIVSADHTVLLAATLETHSELSNSAQLGKRSGFVEDNDELPSMKSVWD